MKSPGSAAAPILAERGRRDRSGRYRRQNHTTLGHVQPGLRHISVFIAEALIPIQSQQPKKKIKTTSSKFREAA